MQREPLKIRAQGHWKGILGAVGLPAKSLVNRHGPCPMCGGRDRFRFDDKSGMGTWICNQCGAGDGIELVKRFVRVEFKEAAQIIERHIGEAPQHRAGAGAGQAANDVRKREAMTALWGRSSAISHDDAAGAYLRSRVGVSEFPPCLRFSPDERHPGPPASFHPCMVAKVLPSDEAIEAGETAAIHRTFLTREGRKADLPNARMMMGAMPTGAAVRLGEVRDGTIGIAEGIETAFAAASLFNLPVWSALTAGLLQAWTPPKEAKAVIVFGDNDHSLTGQAAAFCLAQRLKASGLEVYVEIPSLAGTDWADEWQRKNQREAA